MSTYGLETYDAVGSGITVSADGAPIAKAGGVTLDWESVPAATTEVTYNEEDIVKVGEKFLRYGTIVCRILTASVNANKVGKFAPYGTTTSGADTITLAPYTNGRGHWFILNESTHENDRKSDFPIAIEGGRVYKKRLDVEDAGGFGNEVQTVTLGAGNSGGSFTLTFSGQTTGSIAFDATGANVQTALIALSNIDTGDVAVTGAAGGPYTVTFTGAYADTNVAALTGTGSLTGGVNTVTIATTVTTGPPLANFETVFPMITYVPES